MDEKYNELLARKIATYEKWKVAHRKQVAAHILEVIAEREWNDACEKLAEYVMEHKEEA